MIRLFGDDWPKRLELLPGLAVICDRPTAERRLDWDEAEVAVRTGLADDALPRRINYALTVRIAADVVTGWEGVEEPCTPENVRRLLSLVDGVWQEFFVQYVLPYVAALGQEKNVCAPSPSTITAGAPNIAAGAPI